MYWTDLSDQFEVCKDYLGKIEKETDLKLNPISPRIFACSAGFEFETLERLISERPAGLGINNRAFKREVYKSAREVLSVFNSNYHNKISEGRDSLRLFYNVCAVMDQIRSAKCRRDRGRANVNFIILTPEEVSQLPDDLKTYPDVKAFYNLKKGIFEIMWEMNSDCEGMPLQNI